MALLSSAGTELVDEAAAEVELASDNASQVSIMRRRAKSSNGRARIGAKLTVCGGLGSRGSGGHLRGHG